MSTLATTSLNRTLHLAFLAIVLAGSTACSERLEVALPLLVASGPDNFISFEMRASNGETIWRLEAETPSEVRFLAYTVIPAGFVQMFPEQGAPRPLRIGEALVIESRIPNRVFIHRALARDERTVTILESEMRRIEPYDRQSGAPR